MPIHRRIVTPLPFSTAMNHLSNHKDARMGRAVTSAVLVGYCSAIDFGTSSPTMTCRTVRAIRTPTTETDSAVAASIPIAAESRGARGAATVAWPYAPSTRLETVIPIWHAATYRSSAAGSRMTVVRSRAARFPFRASSSSRLRLTLTAENSAATYKVLINTRTMMTSVTIMRVDAPRQLPAAPLCDACQTRRHTDRTATSD